MRFGHMKYVCVIINKLNSAEGLKTNFNPLSDYKILAMSKSEAKVFVEGKFL